MQKPVLVLGSTGRVGRALRAHWPKSVPVLWQTRTPSLDAETICWDILTGAPPALPPLAGVVGLAGVTAGPDLAQNSTLALAAANLNVPVLLASTQAVYGAPIGAVSETSPVAPVTDYGRAKLDMERAVAGYGHVTCLRLANVIGCDGLAAAMQGGGDVALDQFPDGQGPLRMMISPQALADVICALLAQTDPLPPVMNVAQPGFVSMQAILTAAGATWHWRLAPASALAALEMDVSLLQRYVPDLGPWRETT